MIFEVPSQGDDDSANTDQTEKSEKNMECDGYLENAENWFACCKYPFLMISDEQWKDCASRCQTAENRCCFYTCYMADLGGLTTVRDENGNITSATINWQGIVKSFMMSVGNDPIWEEPLNRIMPECYEKFGSISDQTSCGFVPMDFSVVTDCGTRQSYLQCPNWNPTGLQNCSVNRAFMEKCY